MKYEFQSTSNTRLILAIALGTFLATLSVIGCFLIVDSFPILQTYNQVLYWTMSIITVFLLWLLGKNYLRQDSILQLKKGVLEFQRGGETKEIAISDIESYKYKLVKGVRLTIWTRQNERISIVANDIYCKYDNLELFCSDFDHLLKSLKSNKNEHSSESDSTERFRSEAHTQESKVDESSIKSESTAIMTAETKVAQQTRKEDTQYRIPKRKTTFYERKYAFPFLVIFSALTVVFVMYVLVDDGDVPVAIVVSTGGLLAIWAGYFNHKKK